MTVKSHNSQKLFVIP